VDDCVVAALLTLHRRDVASGWLLGWNPAFAKWNVSELLWLHSVREAAREGLRVFDFLRGNEAYKFRFPVEAEPLRCRQWTVTTRGRVAIGTARLGEQVLASARRWRTRAYRAARTLRRAPA
jgi:CelD/BcsL family acetyltransferase involved in cellulose biosynthesis